MNHSLHRVFPLFLCAALLLSSCHRSQTPAEKRYHFTGRVISIDPPSESAFLYNDDIPGFMDSMGMSYKIKPASMVSQLAPGDLISAEVVVIASKDENSPSVFWLEKVKVTGHVKATPAKPTSQFHMPTPPRRWPNAQPCSDGRLGRPSEGEAERPPAESEWRSRAPKVQTDCQVAKLSQAAN